jgi:hypothetical protein
LNLFSRELDACAAEKVVLFSKYFDISRVFVAQFYGIALILFGVNEFAISLRAAGTHSSLANKLDISHFLRKNF